MVAHLWLDALDSAASLRMRLKPAFEVSPLVSAISTSVVTTAYYSLRWR